MRTHTHTPPALETQHLKLAYDDATIINELDVAVPVGKITALVGPNGCGKSTLLRGLARLLAPRAGAVLLDGKAVHTVPTRELAKRLGILPQGPVAPEGLTVRELVAQGRYPHQSWLRQWSIDDQSAVERALALTGVDGLADRPVDALSGGQRQRAWIAMTLAQETPIILLDEPTTYLDLAHQMEVLQLLERLNRDEHRTIVMVVHDLNHATRHAQHIIAMRSGAVVAVGDPSMIITPALLREVFGVEADVVPDPRTGLPLCLPYGLAETATPRPSLNTISADELYQWMTLTEGPFVLDVRSKEEYTIGHINGAHNIPLEALPTQLAELPRSSQIVVYCGAADPNEAGCEHAAMLLSEHGYDAIVLKGGLGAWLTAETTATV